MRIFKRLSIKHTFVKWIIKTCFLGSILIPLDYFGYLGWLDLTILKLGQFDAYHQPSSMNAKTMLPVTVLEITQEMFEEHFEYSTPLERSKLADVIKLIAKDKPKSINIDLDLSPDLKSAKESNRLSNELIALTKNNIKINLALPFGVNTKLRYQTNLSWVRKMCKGGVNFAEPIVLHHNRAALKLPKVQLEQPTTLYEQAAITNGELNKNSLCLWSENEINAPFSLRSRLYDVTNNAQFSMKRQTLDILNINLLHQINVIKLTSINDLENLKGTITGHTVFFGGAYGNSDLFIVANELIPGVRLQALEYLSLNNRVKTSNAFAFILEVITGLIFFWGFQALWKKRMDYILKGYSYYAKRVVTDLCLTFYTLLYVILIAVFITPYFLTYAIWLNPAPIVAALVLDSFLLAANEDQIKEPKSNLVGINKLTGHVILGGKICLGLLGLYIIIFT